MHLFTSKKRNTWFKIGGYRKIASVNNKCISGRCSTGTYRKKWYISHDCDI